MPNFWDTTQQTAPATPKGNFWSDIAPPPTTTFDPKSIPVAPLLKKNKNVLDNVEGVKQGGAMSLQKLPFGVAGAVCCVVSQKLGIN